MTDKLNALSEARAARQALETMFRLSWNAAVDAAASSDAESLAASKREIRELGDTGLAELTAVVTGQASSAAKLLAVAWIGDMATDSESHALQRAAADALLTYRDAAPDEHATQTASASLVTCLEAATRSDPRDAVVWLCLGDERLNLAQYEAAIAAFDKALEADPGAVNARYFKGIALHRQGDHARAVEWYSAALDLKPDYADVYVARSISRRALDDLDGALADVTAAIEQNPKLAHAYEWRAEIHAAGGNDDLARADLRQAAALRNGTAVER